jgi:hypothetical protein
MQMRMREARHARAVDGNENHPGRDGIHAGSSVPSQQLDDRTMTEERRKSDRRVPPSVAKHAIEENAQLLARIAEYQAGVIARASMELAK